MGPLSRGSKNLVIGLRVHTKIVDITTGSPSPCAKSRGLAAGSIRGCPSAKVIVGISFCSLSVSVLGLSRGRSSIAAGVTPGDADVVDPSTPDDDDAADRWS